MPLKSIPFFGSHSLRFDWEAFENMVEALETPAFSDFGKIVEKLGPKTLRIIVWAGLLHETPGLKQADVFPIINEYLETRSMTELSDVVLNALTESSILGGNDTGEATGQDTTP